MPSDKKSLNPAPRSTVDKQADTIEDPVQTQMDLAHRLERGTDTKKDCAMAAFLYRQLACTSPEACRSLSRLMASATSSRPDYWAIRYHFTMACTPSNDAKHEHDSTFARNDILNALKQDSFSSLFPPLSGQAKTLWSLLFTDLLLTDAEKINRIDAIIRACFYTTGYVCSEKIEPPDSVWASATPLFWAIKPLPDSQKDASLALVLCCAQSHLSDKTHWVNALVLLNLILQHTLKNDVNAPSNTCRSIVTLLPSWLAQNIDAVIEHFGYHWPRDLCALLNKAFNHELNAHFNALLKKTGYTLNKGPERELLQYCYQQDPNNPSSTRVAFSAHWFSPLSEEPNYQGLSLGEDTMTEDRFCNALGIGQNLSNENIKMLLTFVSDKHALETLDKTLSLPQSWNPISFFRRRKIWLPPIKALLTACLLDSTQGMSAGVAYNLFKTASKPSTTLANRR